MVFLMVVLSTAVQAQRGTLFVKKHGFKRVASFNEGAQIKFILKDGTAVAGYIALIKNDSIYVNNFGYHSGNIARIILHENKDQMLKTQLLYIGAGVLLCATGLTLAQWASFPVALAYSGGIGLGNFLLRVLPKVKRSKYKIGKKFSVQTFDLHI